MHAGLGCFCFCFCCDLHLCCWPLARSLVSLFAFVTSASRPPPALPILPLPTRLCLFFILHPSFAPLYLALPSCSTGAPILCQTTPGTTFFNVFATLDSRDSLLSLFFPPCQILQRHVAAFRFCLSCCKCLQSSLQHPQRLPYSLMGAHPPRDLVPLSRTRRDS